MQTFYFTDPGKVRDHNEDSVTIVSNDNKEFVLAIADGMGGHKAGEIASSITTNHIINSFYKLDTIGTKEDAINWLRRIVEEINKEIFKYAKDHPESKGLGTTLVIAIKTNDYIIGVNYTANMNSDTVLEGLKAIQNKAKTAEILVHPCYYENIPVWK